MKLLSIRSAGAALVMSSACVLAQHPADAASMSAQDFVNQAAITNRFEIEAARAAQNKASDPAYKDFAQMIISEHDNLSGKLKAIVADMNNIRLPTALDAAHQQQLGQLRSLDGAAFERQYRISQIDGHRTAIKLFQGYANDGTQPALKALAQSSVPILEKHLHAAENLPRPSATVGANQPATAVPPAGGTVANRAATSTGTTAVTTGAANAAQGTSDPQNLVNEATRLVRQMKADPELAQLMQRAKGMYIVPEFGRGALVVGGRGGAGLVTVRQNGKWSDPAFYDMGGISVGPQVGASGGSIVFLLMNQNAVDQFKSGNSFSLNAGAGLSIVRYSANAQASWGKGDIVLWSDTAGAYVGATISVTNINWDDDNNRVYYGAKVDMDRIIGGQVGNAKADTLRNALQG